MASLNNIKHENFARLVASGKDRGEAYSLVGYRSKNPNQSAYQLWNQKDDSGRLYVQDRVAEIRGEMLKELNIDEYYIYKGVKDILKSLKKEALYGEKGYDRITALKALWEIYKYFADRFEDIKELEVLGGELAEKTDEELNAIIKGYKGEE